MYLLLTPPIAFLVYLLLVWMLSVFGKSLAGKQVQGSEMKSSTYSSGEAPPTRMAAPGYRPFFVAALFFAVLHLGVLVMSTGGASKVMVIYLLGLMVALLAMILG